jgi:DNA-binding CsgD family transcriptional regulator
MPDVDAPFLVGEQAAMMRLTAFLSHMCMSLTKRETRLVVLLLQGKTPRHVADSMGITLTTCRTYMKRIYGKFNVHTREELTARIFSTWDGP